MATQNLTDAIFQAVETIVQKGLNDLHFDVTERCTIVALDSETTNTYRVKNNNITYTAKALNDAKYEVDDIVSVTVSKGDYSGEKIIIGKYTSTEDTPRTYKEPLDTILEYGTIELDSTISLKTPGSIERRVISVNDEDDQFFENYCNASSLGAFNYTGISFDLKTDWGEIDHQPRGDYYISVKFLNRDNQLLHALYENVSPLLFSNNDVDGDPYNLQFEGNSYNKVWNFPSDLTYICCHFSLS